MEFGYTRLHQSYSGIAVISNAPNTNREFISISYQFTRTAGKIIMPEVLEEQKFRTARPAALSGCGSPPLPSLPDIAVSWVARGVGSQLDSAAQAISRAR